MCFNTTVSNAWYTNGAGALLQEKLGKEHLSCGCRHHIFELFLLAAFSACDGPEAPIYLLFRIFIEHRQNRFSTAHDYKAMASAVSGLRQDMLLFAGEQLRTQCVHFSFTVQTHRKGEEALQRISIFVVMV